MTALADVGTIAKLIVKHIDAGHTETDHRLVTDLETLLTDVHTVLDAIHPPATEREQLSFIVRTVAAIDRRTETIVSVIGDQIQVAAGRTGLAADAAANRVIDLINSDRSALKTLQDKSDADDILIAALQAQITAGTVTPEAAQAVIDSLTATNTKLGDLDSDPLTPV